MTSNPAELYQQAQQSIRDGDYEGAEKCFRMLIALLPDVPQPHFEIAELLTKMGKNLMIIINHYEMFIQMAGDDLILADKANQARDRITQLLNQSNPEITVPLDVASIDISLPNDRIVVDKRGKGHFTRLADAIANNPYGLPIHLRPGRYNEVIMVTDSSVDLEIFGPPSGDPAILMSTKDHCIYVDCSHLDICHLTISNSSPKAAVQIVGGQVSFTGCEFLDCTTAAIDIQYESRLDLRDGNVFFGGGTALRVFDQTHLEVGTEGPNFFFSNLGGSVHASGHSKFSIHQARINYPSDLITDEVLGSLPYFGLGEVPIIWLQDNAEGEIKDSKLTGWGTLIYVEDNASLMLSNLESKSSDGFSKQVCTPEAFLKMSGSAAANIEKCKFSSGVVGALGVECKERSDVQIRELLFGGEITMLKLDGGKIAAERLNHEDPHGQNVVGLQAEAGSVIIAESYLPFVDMIAQIEANFHQVRFGARDALGNAFKGKISFENCGFSGSSHFDGQIEFLNCYAKNPYTGDAWLSFYSGKATIKGGQFINHAFALGCNFEIAEASFSFEEGYASPQGVIDILQGAYGKLKKCSITSALPKTHPALRIHRQANVRQIDNAIQGKVEMYR
ncbi:MAG: hypothetical protein ISR58_12620 [Anaerolineales bacterium]|nr:hypothetical protein [Chloroflexota bacterium]MBL6982023.1 hypothetical protein [Anaerolineales bacterium]